MKQRSDILGVFPERLREPLRKVFSFFGGDIYEIRLIADKCVFLCTSSGIRFINGNGFPEPAEPERGLCVSAEELEEITDRAMGYSGFAHEEELRQCCYTRPDGTRVGIAFSGCGGTLGTGEIRSLNIRLPVGCPSFFSPRLDSVLASDGGILIAGRPNSGKTTLLRYCCRMLSDGTGGRYRKVCAVDERNELSGGTASLGACTDVIAGRSKHEGILTALRLMSPDYIVCDEIGSFRETQSILEGLNSGVSFVASMHAADLKQLVRRCQFRLLFDENVFEYVVFLSSACPGTIEKIYTYEEVADEIYRSGSAFGRGGAYGGIYELPQEKKSGYPVEAV